MSFVPATARRILDMDIGSSGLPVDALPKPEIISLETAARQTVGRPDALSPANVEEMDLGLIEGPFDCIVCQSLLPCLRDPVKMLEHVRRLLSPGGVLIACIPNLRHRSVVAGLLQGRWKPQTNGPSSCKPIRFYTRREIEKLFFRAGYAIDVLEGLTTLEGGGLHAGSGDADLCPFPIAGLPPELTEEMRVSHYHIRAAPAPPLDFGLTSIVILTHNQLDYTRMCVDSIRQYTGEPHELIFVDNASTDGTPEYLAGVPGAQVIRNSENRGFPAAANQGINAAKGRQILLLNNDTVMTTGWLGRMLRALHADPQVGLVGPCINCVSGEQQVAVSYEDLLGLDGFAWEWGKTHNRLTADTDRLVAFCFLIRREVIDAIGLLDERFGIGCFEDDDYCRRAHQAVYRAVIARDAFVHHFGSRTFLGAGLDFAGILRKNQEVYRQKWDKEVAPQKILPPRPTSPVSRPGRAERDFRQPQSRAYKLALAPGGGLRLVRENILISLCMIVRDNARTIEAALTSIRPWVDEMIVVDTGSNDDTPRIAERLGARVFHFPWCDDFSAARNESLRHARGRWIFWMDSDDVIDETNGRKLRELASRDGDPGILGYVVQVHCPGRETGDPTDFTAVDHVKLFRNLPELRFEERIHEQILPAISRAGGKVAETGLFVLHAGYDTSPEGQKRKLERDLRILHKALIEDPKHPFTLFNLGMTYADCEEHEKALQYLEGSSAHSAPQSSHLRKVHALMVTCHSGMGNHQAASEACERGLAPFPKDAELLFRKALLLQQTGRLREAIVAYRHLLETNEEGHFKSVVWGLRGFKGRQNLAMVHQELGEWQDAEDEWRRVVREAPAYRPGWLGLGEALVHREKLIEAAALAEQLLSDGPFSVEGSILRVKVAAARGDLTGAWRELERMSRDAPDNMEPLESFCQILFQAGNLAEAERALRELIRRRPEDVSAHYNLGMVYQQSGRPHLAAEELKEAARFETDRPLTYINLGHALRNFGMQEEAIQAFEKAHQLDPLNREARDALEEMRSLEK